MLLRIAQSVLWRMFQMFLIVAGMVLFWAVVGKPGIIGGLDMGFLATVAAMVFGGLFAFLVTVLTCAAIDRFRYMRHGKGSNDGLGGTALGVGINQRIENLDRFRSLRRKGCD